MFGCGCIFAILAAISPRFVLFLVWIFTPYVSQTFNSFIVPLLGFIFLPFTTLILVLVYDPVFGLVGWDWFWLLLAFVLDIGAYSGSAYTNKNRL